MTSGSRLAVRQPIQGTPEELAGHGIGYRSEDLFTGRATTPGAEIHFGMVRLTDQSLPFWRRYRLSAGKVADLLAGLAKKLERSGDRVDLESVAEEYGWSRDRIHHIAEVVRRRSYGARSIFRSVKGGVIGIEWLLDEEFAPTEDRFVAYAASRPLPDELPSPSEPEPETAADLVGSHERIYSPLLVTVGVATERGLPTVTHFGIFRNPLAFLDADPGHRGLAMQLHGFAATVALHAWSNKVFMTTNPMHRMQEILLKRMCADDVHVAEDDAGLRACINQNLPPGVAPIEEGRRFSFAGFTSGAPPVAVRLVALSAHYKPAG